MHLAALAADKLHYRISNESDRDPRRDAGSERHHQHDGECRESLVKFLPLNSCQALHHEAAYNNECRCGYGGKRGNGTDERRDEDRQGKQAADDQRGKPGTPACCYACRRFDIGGGRTCPEHGADRRCGCIRQQSRLGTRQLAILHRTGLFGNADQCPGGIKQSYEQEGEYGSVALAKIRPANPYQKRRGPAGQRRSRQNAADR